MKSETAVQSEIRAFAANVPGVSLWRNNSGAMYDERGRIVRFGLGNDSAQLNKRFKTSDLIGSITRRFFDDTGDYAKCLDIAVFLAVEVKEEGWKFSPNDAREKAQKAFIDTVRHNGGVAGFCQSVEDFRELIGV